MRHPLERSRHDPVFLSQPSPTLLLSRNFTIEAVTRSYLASTGRSEDQLIATNVFEAFPENPATREIGSTKDFTDSFERVLRTRRPHYLSPLRYDVEDPCHPGEFIEKRWVLVNTPVQDGDDVLGVLVRVDDVTLANEDLLKALRVYRDTLARADLRTPAARDRLDSATSFLSVVESYAGLAAEVTDLRQALRTRPAIEQAKGIIMADRRCSDQEAFDLLKQLSMETNVRIADVAAAVIYQLRAPR
ncbi:MAG: ANTAR domain-containing protein [Nocardioidaceae bacterium]